MRLHGQNACYVIFWNIAPKHWIYMDTGYCNTFYFCLRLYNYWEYVIECAFAVETTMHFVTFFYEKCHSWSVVTFLG
jgi:hypothetical protein